MKETLENQIERPPIVVVMGHVDHGKSTLLDYIRKTNIVDSEAGGITQHISAYEVLQTDETGKKKKITFLDTPGHEAFSHMRSRGAIAADIAILVVSAEDSVKAQTLEAWQTIVDSNLPFIVAINKIDKPNANEEKVKLDLAEKGIYLEGYGGDIPFVALSAKIGTGVPLLLDMILLVAEMKEFRGSPSAKATGVVIESHLEQKRGVATTLIIKDGTLTQGEYVVIGDAFAPVRIFEDFLGKAVTTATFSSPIRITGFSKLPSAGSTFVTCASKKEAETLVEIYQQQLQKEIPRAVLCATSDVAVIPIVVRTDVMGTGEAVQKEIRKYESDCVKFKILSLGVGAISETDIKSALADPTVVILGFNTKLDPRAREMNEQVGATVGLFSIIYELGDYVQKLASERKPRKETVVVTGQLKIIKCFSTTKERQVVGGKVIEGKLLADSQIRILRREFEIGKGKIIGLEQGKAKVRSVDQDGECGVLIESKTAIAPGDIVEAFIVEYA